MQISQEELYRDETQALNLLDILIVLFAFTGPVIHSLLFIVNARAASGQMAIVYIMVAVGSVILFVRNGRRFLSRNILNILLLMFVATASFFITGVVYGRGNALFISEERAFLGMEGCILLLVLNISWTNKSEINTQLILVFDVILSVVCFFALTRGNSLTSGGYIYDTSGFLYQNISYYSAYGLGMNMFLLNEYKGKPRTKWLSVLFLVLTLVQLFSAFMSGGRGGVFLAVVLLAYGLLTIYGFRRAYKMVLPAAITVIAVIFIFPSVIDRFGVSMSGLSRVLSFFSTRNTDRSTIGRAVFARNAMTAFNERPAFGHGIGSIFYLVGNYSHNVFTDVLAETGVVGLIIVTLILISFLRKVRWLYKEGSFYRFLLMVFVCGISLNLFSGYLWVNQHVWLPVAVVMMAPRARRVNYLRTRETR